MIRIPSFTWALLLVLSGASSGCALLTKADPVVPRYYSPETASESAGPGAISASGLSVRLGRVGGGSYLKERIAFRASDHQFGFYDDKRWTERPEVYLQRALEKALFEEHGVKRALASSSPTLTADLVEFEEVRDANGASTKVRLRISYALHDERTVFRERSFSVERPLTAGTDADRVDRVAAGLGDAMREAVTQIVNEVIADLSAQAPKPG